MSKFIVLVICIIAVLFYVKYHNMSVKEKFVALTGIESQLTTYDSYGTFNFLFNTNDLPYYDPTYDNLGCEFREKAPVSLTTCGTGHGTTLPYDDFNTDSFIEYEAQKVRRNMVPYNYWIEQSFADAKFDRNQLHLAIKKDRPRASAVPPKPQNYYFNKEYIK